MPRFFAALAILLLALSLQFFFASAGLYFNFTLATIIAFAFTLDFLELLTLDLLAVFILDWQSAPSVALITFALIPLAAFAFRQIVRSEPWSGNLVAIVFGLFVFYLVSAPSQFFPAIAVFFEDAVISIAVGMLVFFAMEVRYH